MLIKQNLKIEKIEKTFIQVSIKAKEEQRFFKRALLFGKIEEREHLSVPILWKSQRVRS